MAEKLPASAHIGRVALSVADLERSLTYYQERIGLTLLEVEGQTRGTERVEVAVLGTPERELLHLHEQPGARPTRGATGLYHFALLVPSRLELAHVLQHLVNTETPIDGASDHAVSEALYLTDPDGHGIEIYRDRPRAEWPYLGGTLQMGTKPFDVQGVLAELNGVSSSDWISLDPQTTMGHVHLHIGHLQSALDFYTDVVGFDMVMRYGPSAGFVSAGGYHHHLGLNTWAGVGAPPPPADAARLLWYEIVMAEVAGVELETRLKSAGVAVVRNGSSLQFQDPFANTIHINPL